MNASQAQVLAGALVAAPGRVGAALQSSRREWAPLLGRGRRASELPPLLSAAYALCGRAHELAASAAIAAARQQQAWRANPAQRDALRIDTLREHLRRIALDWPRVLPWPGAEPAPLWLAHCPLLRDDAGVGAGLAWIERELLGRGAADWLSAWDASSDDFTLAWVSETATPVARWLGAAHAHLQAMAVPLRALAVPDAAGARILARHLRAEPGFALLPTWAGQPAETGPWTRLAQPAPSSGAGAMPLMRRLTARVAEIARLAQGQEGLAQGALAVGPGEGLSWCEMARGLLVHWVRLEPAAAGADPVVDAVRVLAPTEWNFHPRGALAQLLEGLPPDAPQAVIELAAAAFDPCVALHVERAAVAEEPECTR